MTVREQLAVPGGLLSGWTRSLPSTRPGRLFLGFVGIIAILVLWQLLPAVGAVDARYLPPPSAVAGEMLKLFGEEKFWQALGQTMAAWSIGLGIASIAAIVVGIILGMVPLLREFTASSIEFLRPIPSVALIPLVVLLFGTDMRSALVLVVYASFWQVLIQVMYGTSDVDPVARDTARSFRFRSLTIVRTVIWPTALPYVMTGLRLGAAVALIIEVTAELIIGTPGIGKLIAVAQSSGATGRMFALVVVSGIIGVVVNAGARGLEARLLRWHPSIRGEEPR